MTVDIIINISKYENILGTDFLEHKDHEHTNDSTDNENDSEHNTEKQNNHYDIHIILERFSKWRSSIN